MSAAEMSPVDRLVVRAELDDLLRRLSQAVDRSDRDGVAACYTTDSLDEHGSFVGTGAQFADYICRDSPISATARFLHHMLGQSLYTFETADSVYGETYFVFHMQSEQGQLFVGIGRYLDHFVRMDGTWLLKHRQLVTEWNGFVEAQEIPGAADHIVSRRDQDDPLYHFIPALVRPS